MASNNFICSHIEIFADDTEYDYLIRNTAELRIGFIKS